MNNCKIGVFDSGVGGLTVLKNLRESLPNESFIYVGDNLHSPYGEKTTAQLLTYTSDIISFFIQQNCKLVVLACNTTSCTVLDLLKEKYPQLPMLGVIDATVEMVHQDNPRFVAVMATQATIQSNAYQTKLGRHQSIGIACPHLVPLIENGADKTAIIQEVRGYLNEVKEPFDGIVLGCTHYPIIAETIQKLYPDAKLYSSSVAVVKQVENYLKQNQLEATHKKEKDMIYTTGNLEKFIESSSSFFDYQKDEVAKLTLKVV